MQTMKRAISVLFCCILLAAFALPAFAEDTLIAQASADYPIPAEGETFDFSAITVPDGAHYTAKITKVYYQKDGKWQDLAADEAVFKNVRYAVRIYFTADKGYCFDDSKTSYVINGETGGTLIGEHLIETDFYAAAGTPEPDEPVKLTLWQRVVNFLLNIRSRIVYVFWLIRHLFGLI